LGLAGLRAGGPAPDEAVAGVVEGVALQLEDAAQRNGRLFADSGRRVAGAASRLAAVLGGAEAAVVARGAVGARGTGAGAGLAAVGRRADVAVVAGRAVADRRAAACAGLADVARRADVAVVAGEAAVAWRGAVDAEDGGRHLVDAGAGEAVHQHVPRTAGGRGELAEAVLVRAVLPAVVVGGGRRAAGLHVQVEVAAVVDRVHRHTQSLQALPDAEAVATLGEGPVERAGEGQDGPVRTAGLRTRTAGGVGEVGATLRLDVG